MGIEGGAIVINYGLRSVGEMIAEGLADHAPETYNKLEGMKELAGRIASNIDNYLSNSDLTKEVYVDGKKYTVALLDSSMKNSPETLKTFLEMGTLGGASKLKPSFESLKKTDLPDYKPDNIPGVKKAGFVENPTMLNKHFNGKIDLDLHEGDCTEGTHLKNTWDKILRIWN